MPAAIAAGLGYTPAILRFSIPVGNALDVSFAVPPGEGVDINAAGAVVIWQAFTQSCGVPSKADGPLIAKDSSSGGVSILGSPPGVFIVHFVEADTAGLYPGNAYYEALALDASGVPTTVALGVMTVTETQIEASLS